ncbi:MULTISPECIES: succinate dehydrogenase, cytochrome b556 subunit [Thermomonas]|jgi:succinate dehydrogenase / fumarate reductase cytochrome b subunit|uniref:Succinate dehydrogenase cytochrome b556 subunit n=1 Tax=Thermomonas fusca TaxID=215690 RepID=A0A5R9PE04_9GAMM|nr:MULTISPECIES: succinate dehydrogenase, cytochrome b556 subunit [Thermomonas]MBH2009900.1 succinate dehydrogenase, cytochrome b556 subunit [Xanthomonadaceae bacterium]TLX21307.1 succinate dehydrogenase, cytochrome b556 subunit [Thermomonas fusca]
MAAPEPRIRERPLSPHLQVYRWQMQMMTSIIHRATGTALSVGALALVYGLLALAGGPARWNAFATCLGSPLGKLLMFGFSWALAYHLINGIRHLLQDGGLGFAIPDFIRSSWISIIGSVVFTVLAWGIVLTRWGQA